MNKQKTNGWKITAIIFIILFVLENIGIGFLMVAVQKDLNKEDKCIYNICSDYTSYIYYDFNGLCECYKDGIVMYTEFID